MAESGLPLILYQACLDPWAVFSIPFYLVMPLNQIIVYVCDAVIISSNMFLYRFLKQHTSNNSGKWNPIVTSDNSVQPSLPVIGGRKGRRTSSRPTSASSPPSSCSCTPPSRPSSFTR